MKASANLRKTSIYDRLGGAEGVEKLVNTFCDVLETTEVGRPIHLLHLRGHGMAHARMEQFNFFSGMFGGPKLYAEKWGHSNVRQIHDHVDITEAHKDAWLASMQLAIERLDYEPALKQNLMQHFEGMASLLVNH
ncbi:MULTISPECIES: group II truncated hemoglobin [unclassified Methylophaga]|jgi:hemoglobin|uniref:group II truncated hemoglobin n=1 Tax=unclassified Methylophaga TaxID=2629249 RepID=UPI000C8D9431|nr:MULTISPECIES: group II truncated hemoglobin [unclassified Methylophaga]MAK66615.1 globin [Methylophaga sp.]MAY18361.1 globin [Methylophaga sp.]MAY18365.1 globin [Methylophaga sp.]MBN46657.1 globin [Methylophaga sp.]HAO24273.1 globin [Methylophaga sp.]|tara:strand:+ start:190 stop:594 length:405 start_codon:yes stop_codon:yes gene_type:complete